MNEPITTLEELTIDMRRETRIDYSESRTVRTVSIETYLTFDELAAIVRDLRGEVDE